MEKRDSQVIKKYLAYAIIILLIVFSYLILKPYLIALISAFLLAYLTLPLFNVLKKRVGKRLAALICIITVLILIILPLAIVVNGVTQQAYAAVTQNDFKEILRTVFSTPPINNFNLNIDEIQTKGINLLVSIITNTLQQIPLVLISIVITLWGIYYILLNWSSLSKDLKNYLPFGNKEETAKEIDQATRSILYGTFIVAILELIVAALGFYILGIKTYLLLASLIAILAFVPGLGPGLVWVPTAVFYLFTGNPLVGIGVIVIGLIISIVIETFIAGKIIEKATNINPLIRFVGVLGGVAVFGIFGFVIGPLVLVYTLKLIENIKNGN